MYHRYLGDPAGRESLPSMVYFFLTMLELMVGGDRKAVAKKFGISSKVLNKVGVLRSNAGGAAFARETEDVKQPFEFGDETCLRIVI